MKKEKQLFEKQLTPYIKQIKTVLEDENGKWSMRAFQDIHGNYYPISGDTKVVSKLLENQVFPILKEFAKKYNYEVILTKHQNYYPDATLRSKDNPELLFAVDLKTTYRDPKKSELCNGFTLGSHGSYFHDRKGTKNIMFPYADYIAHYSLGIIYDREAIEIDETEIYSNIVDVPTPISNFDVFLVEKWKIASDKRGSGNTANIGSIKNIDAIKKGQGTFAKLGESVFDSYWLQYGKTTKLMDYLEII
jgi:hypothetical protein